MNRHLGMVVMTLLMKVVLLAGLLALITGGCLACDPDHCFRDQQGEWELGDDSVTMVGNAWDWGFGFDWGDTYGSATDSSYTYDTLTVYSWARRQEKMKEIGRKIAEKKTSLHSLKPAAYVGDGECEAAADDILQCMHDESDQCTSELGSLSSVEDALIFTMYSSELMMRWLDCVMDSTSYYCVVSAIGQNDCELSESDFNLGDMAGSMCNMLTESSQCIIDRIYQDCGQGDADVVASVMENVYGPTTELINCNLGLVVADVPVNLIAGCIAVGIAVVVLGGFGYYCYKRGHSANQQARLVAPAAAAPVAAAPAAAAPATAPIHITNVTHQAPAPIHYPAPVHQAPAPIHYPAPVPQMVYQHPPPPPHPAYQTVGYQPVVYR